MKNLHNGINNRMFYIQAFMQLKLKLYNNVYCVFLKNALVVKM